MKVLSTSFILFFATFLGGQDVESELGFVYMKAEYILETQRYGEAIQEYTKVISQDPTYQDAYRQRAEAKYALLAYQGVKDDIIELISIKGVDANSVRLLGLAESQLGNHGPAVNSLLLAHGLFPKESEIITALASSAYEANDPSACKVLQSKNGNNTVAKYLATVCKTPSTKPSRNKKSPKNTKTPPTDTSEPSRPSKATDKRVDDIVTVDPSTSQQQEIPNTSDNNNAEAPSQGTVIDDTVNRIVIDEDLTIVVKNGIGSRMIVDQPSILLLSEKAGQVTVDICISKAGRVESAAINAAETTINTESLKSLALRKAKEFWFGRGDEQCGTLVLEINGN